MLNYIMVFDPNDIKLGPIVGGPKSPTRKLSQLINILSKTFLKHVENFIRDSLDFFLINFLTYVDKDHKIVTFGVTSLYTSTPQIFDHEAIDYFLPKHQEDLHPTFKKEFVLESTNFNFKNNMLTFDSEFYFKVI